MGTIKAHYVTFAGYNAWANRRRGAADRCRLPRRPGRVLQIDARHAQPPAGDRPAIVSILDDWRERLRNGGQDPFGDVPTEELSQFKLDKVLTGSGPIAAGLVHTAIEEFATELATVVRRSLRLETWQGAERIVVGGGLSASQIGHLAMGRAAVMLAGEGFAVELRAFENHPDEASLVGAIHLAPSWVLAGHDAILAADIGGRPTCVSASSSST